MTKELNGLVIDCFAGGGGASIGIEMATGTQVDIAINHDEGAIRMHKSNHPDTLHLTEDIFKVDLKKYVNGQHVALMWASPACQGFSKARAREYADNQLRILPWSVFKHARAIKPDVIIMENVVEIQTWGPLDENGKIIKERQGEEYNKFISKMKAIGYDFDSRELVAADYGAPTIRKRWYAIFRRDGKPIVWPENTHSENGENGLKKWVPVSSVLNLDNVGRSIPHRVRPLALKTVERIRKGMEKFIFQSDNPYLILIGDGTYCHEKDFITDDSVFKMHCLETHKRAIHSEHVIKRDTLVLGGARIDSVTNSSWMGQFIIEYYGQSIGQSISDPLHTIVTKDRFALVTVLGNDTNIIDVYMRMLTPEELKLAQGFPDDYIIDHDILGKKLSVKEQVLRIGNSVVPKMAQILVESNLFISDDYNLPIAQ